MDHGVFIRWPHQHALIFGHARKGRRPPPLGQSQPRKRHAGPPAQIERAQTVDHHLQPFGQFHQHAVTNFHRGARLQQIQRQFRHRAGQGEKSVLGRQPPRLAHPRGAHRIAKPQRRRHGFRQTANVPDPFGGHGTQRRHIGLGLGKTFIFDDLQIVFTRHRDNIRPTLQAHACRRWILGFWCQTKHLRAILAADCLQHIGADAFVVQLNPNHIGAHSTGCIAKARIGQIFGQNHRTVAAQTAVENQADATLSAMGQHDVVRRHWPQITFA